MRILILLALLIVTAPDLFAEGVPATGCATTAPSNQGNPRNYPCCTHPDYEPDADGFQCLAPISVFELVLKEFGFLRSDGTHFYFGSQQTFDLASADAGTAFGSFVAAADLPAGNYVGIIPVIGKSVHAEIDVTIAGGRRCTLNDSFIMIDDSEGGLPVCDATLPNLETMECIESNGNFGRFVDDHPINVTYDPARGMNVQFGFWLDNGALCDFSGSSNVTATFFDMPVVARVTAN